MTTWNDEIGSIWTAPCDDWQIDFAPDAVTFGPRMKTQLEDALAEHITDCLTCSRALRDEIAERERKAAERAEADLLEGLPFARWSVVERRHKERETHVNVVMPLIMKALDDVTDPVIRAILDHHAKDTSWSSTPRCNGCDQGCSCDCPEWPCTTVETVAKALGHEWPDDSYLWRRA